MKAIKICCLACVLLTLATLCFAQSKTETLKVSGECGMCKKKIEKAAKDAGATYAVWNVDSKILTVKYNSASTNTARIEKQIAGVGYDTPDFQTTLAAYNKLDKCCQYDRTSTTNSASQHNCSATCTMKDGKCQDEATCKANGCCKDGAACKDGSCCKKAD